MSLNRDISVSLVFKLRKISFGDDLMDDANIMHNTKSSMPQEDRKQLASAVVNLFPAALGAYVFGSFATGETRADSDLDVAILQLDAMSVDAVLALKSYISQTFRRDSDIVDLLRADTVIAAQVVVTGVEILSIEPRKLAEFETMALSRYALLNEERAEILHDIEKKGTIYGR